MLKAKEGLKFSGSAWVQPFLPCVLEACSDGGCPCPSPRMSAIPVLPHAAKSSPEAEQPPLSGAFPHILHSSSVPSWRVEPSS